MVALSLAQLPGNTGLIALAMGGLDNKIYLYCGERTGKDKGIRIWKLTLRGSLANTEGTYRSEISLASYIEGPVFVAGSFSYQISLESLLIGHEDWKTGIWMNVATVGELSHCALGFYGGHWSQDAHSILAQGYGGSFHVEKYWC
ncbi:hypothetical protein CRYUN_Cryun29cG0037100 [Craigia yunnanensis]